MKDEQVDLNKKTTSNSDIIAFFWHHIKPYKWFYAIMLLAPTVGSFYPFACHYAIKLFLDAMENKEFTSYHSVLLPMFLFLGAEVVLNIVWRSSNVAEWKSEPYVRRSILLETYDYVQHHSFLFFQNNFAGSIGSKLKGILDGYDKFWAEMHHGLFFKIIKSNSESVRLGICKFLFRAFYFYVGGTLYSSYVYII